MQKQVSIYIFFVKVAHTCFICNSIISAYDNSCDMTSRCGVRGVHVAELIRIAEKWQQYFQENWRYYLTCLVLKWTRLAHTRTHRAHCVCLLSVKHTKTRFNYFHIFCKWWQLRDLNQSQNQSAPRESDNDTFEKIWNIF